MSAPYLIKIGSQTLEITSKFTPAVEYLFDDQQLLYAEKRIWPITSYFKGTTATNVVTKYNDLKTILDSPSFDVKFTDSASTVLVQILTTDTDGKGPRCTSYNIPEPSSWARVIPFSATIEALIPRRADKALGIVKLNFTDSYKVDRMNKNIVSQTRSGDIIVTASASAKTILESKRSSWGFTSSATIDISSDDINVSDDDSKGTFTFTKKTRIKAKPGGIDEAKRSVLTNEANGLRTTTFNATFAGNQAEAQARAFLDESKGLKQSLSLTENQDTAEWSVSWVLVDAIDGSGLINIEETINISGGRQPRFTRPVMGGNPPVIFKGRFTHVEVNQSATITAIRKEALLKSNAELLPYHFSMNEEEVSEENFTAITLASRDKDGKPLLWKKTISRKFIVADSDALGQLQRQEVLTL